MAATVTDKSKPRKATRPTKRATKAPAKKTGGRGGAFDAARKRKMAEGQQASRAVNRYLELLDQPHRRIPSDKKLNRLKSELPTAKGLKRVYLLQQLADAEAALVAAQNGGPARAEAEQGFIKHAKHLSDVKGISYAAWRIAGVPAVMLKRAGISATRLG